MAESMLTMPSSLHMSSDVIERPLLGTNDMQDASSDIICPTSGQLNYANGAVTMAHLSMKVWH